jgi:hypothetical protein
LPNYRSYIFSCNWSIKNIRCEHLVHLAAVG